MTAPASRAQITPRSSPGRCIAVRVGAALYGLHVDEVQEVVSMRPITRVFHAPAVLCGVTNLRGDVLPVIDLGVMLGAEASPLADEAEHRIVVVREASGAKRRAGLRVDALSGLRELPAEGLAPVPATLESKLSGLFVGIIPDSPPCAVLSVTRIFAWPELLPLSGVVAAEAT